MILWRHHRFPCYLPTVVPSSIAFALPVSSPEALQRHNMWVASCPAGHCAVFGRLTGFGHKVQSVAMAACSPPTAACETLPKTQRRSAPRHRGARPASASASSSSSVAPAPSFEQLYVGLAGVLAAPGASVLAAPTPLGRGLVATQPIAQGSALLSGGCSTLMQHYRGKSMPCLCTQGINAGALSISLLLQPTHSL